jgi:hypothetical protein
MTPEASQIERKSYGNPRERRMLAFVEVDVLLQPLHSTRYVIRLVVELR